VTERAPASQPVLNGACSAVNIGGCRTFQRLNAAVARQRRKKELIMSTKKLAMALALGVASVSAMHAQPASAAVAVGVSIGPRFAPPAPIVERYVVRRGYVWAPGYWRWNGYRYGRRAGYWVRPRVGYRYAPARWVACGPRWCYHGGRWVR
jgi:WXXGXW repeat (2 copies)